MQETVASASVLPPKPPPFQPTVPSHQPNLPHAASQTYLDQHRAFVERQRKLHEEERALWHLERQELHQKIQNLETVVRQLRSKSESDVPSPIVRLPPRVGGSGSFPTSKGSSRAASSESGKGEVWLGPGARSDVAPTRTYSEASSTSSLSGVSGARHLASISEEQPPMTRKKSVGFHVARPLSPPSPAPATAASIPGEKIHADLDGITFRPSIANSVWTPDSTSRSPLKSPSPGAVSPGAVSPGHQPDAVPRPQLLDLPAAALTPDQRLTRDAGHTPLARVADDASSGSDIDTPTATAVREASREPREPRPSVAAPTVRPPAERAGSYFPAVAEEGSQEEEEEEDPPLREPLALGGDAATPESATFLSALDSKLRGVQRAEGAVASSPETSPNAQPPLPSQQQHRGDGGGPQANGHDTGGNHPPDPADDDDHMPQLRVKRSLNFGTVFGARTIGHDA